jgi:signal transduction histidine kinase
MTALRKHWIMGMMLVILAGGLATVVNMAVKVGQPFGGFFTTRSYIWLVDAPTPPWWPALNESGVRYDDELVAMEGQPYGADSYLLYAEALKAGKRSVTLTVRRGGTLLQLDIPIRTFTFSNLLDLKLPDLLVGIGFWLLAAAVYVARPQKSVNRIFAAACSLTAGAIWLTTPALFPQSDSLTHGIQIGWVFSAAFVGVAFMHLATLFPEPVHRNAMRWIKALYLLMALTAVIYTISLFLRWQDYESPLANQLSTVSNRIVIGMFGLAVVIYLARLIQLASMPKLSRRVRRQVMVLFSGLVLALPYVLIVVIRALMGESQSYFWNGLDVRYLVLAVPLSFAFVILRYQSFQRTPLPVIGVLILASSALVASLAAWVMRIAEPNAINALTWTPFAPLFVILLLTSVFWSSQSSWWGVFSRLFQWERRSYAAVRKFGQQVINEIELSQLPQTIAKALVKNMELERAAVWLWNEKESAYQLLGQAGEWPQPPPMRLFPTPLPTDSRSIRIHEESEPFPGWLEPLGRSGMIEVVTPLTISGSAIGLLGSGKRWDEEIFDERDLQITELIAQQAGLFLLTALQIEQLRQVPQEIATAQERERFKIAQELHDTVQQFLGRLPFFLEVSRSSARSNPEETEAILKRCIEDVDGAAKAVRQIRNNLAPLQLEKNLSQPLRLLIEQFSVRNEIETQVSISPEADTRISAEARHALYRVVQQALDNIAAHAGASHVSIRIEPIQERLHFSITDDGQGFSAAQRATAEESGSFGLKSMEARITSQGGEFIIQPGPQAGTDVSGWLPMLLSTLPTVAGQAPASDKN